MQNNNITGLSLSVVIPAYNSAHFLSDAINSVLKHELADIEIVIVDDGSVDHTASICKSYGSIIRYIYQVNAGVSSARNTGIKNATGDLIILIDADDIFVDNAIFRLLSAFEEDHQEDVGIAYGGAVKLIGNKKISNNSEYYQQKEKLTLEDFLLYNRIPLSGTMFRRLDAICVDGFDVSLRWREDWDFILRLTFYKKRHFINTDSIYYRVHDLQASQNNQKYRSGNNVKAIKKNKLYFYQVENGRQLYKKAKSIDYLNNAYGCYPKHKIDVIFYATMSLVNDKSRMLEVMKLIISTILPIGFLNRIIKKQ
jgi:glycosyltransferase involved in cell wall biosynthesis